MIDADKVVKEMTVPGTEYMSEIKKNIGEEFFEENGNLNKKKLAEKIYSDETALKNLNSLTFKYVVNEMKKRVAEEKGPLIVIDAPLLIEAELDQLCNLIIAVIADKNIKIQRICKRDGLDEKTAESRLKIQNKDEFYIKASDFVIYNNGEKNLEQEIEKIYNQII